MDNTSRLGIILWIYIVYFVQMTLAENGVLSSNLQPSDSGIPGDLKLRGINTFGEVTGIKDRETMGLLQHNQVLNVPVIVKEELNIDIEFGTKAELLVEESPGDHVQFELATYSPYSMATEPGIRMSHVVMVTDSVQHIKLHVGTPPDPSYSLGMTGGLVTVVAILLAVALLCQGETIQHRKKKRKRSYAVDFPGWTQKDVSEVPSSIPAMLNPAGVHHPTPGANDTPQQIHESCSSGDGQSQDNTDKEDGIITRITQTQTQTQTVGGSLISSDKNKEIHVIPKQKDGDGRGQRVPAVYTVTIETARMSMGRVSSWLYEHVCSNHKVLLHNPGKLSKPSIVCLCVMLSLAVVYAVHHGTSSKHVLKVFLPQTSLIRRVRSYSEEPDLSRLSVNTSSLSLVTHVRLMDLRDLCKRNLTACDTYALCEAGFGSLRCRCKRGFYLLGNTCQLCTTSVPEGFYMKESCTADGDVVFRECSKCRGSEYQVAPCTTTQNTMCLDVSFPLDHFKWNASYLRAGNFSPEVHTSKNVFVEKISGMKDVVTPVYMANNQQSMQFTFPRESGLQVKVTVSDIFLVPEYVDLDHVDDSEFFKSDHYQMINLTEHFKGIQKRYCRHPLPDHYKMTLELFRDFTSAARVVSCPPQGTVPAQCPPSYLKDDQYLERSYTTPCPEMPGNFSQLKQARNIIYCSEDTVLLRETFRVHAADVTPLSFPTPKCKGYQDDCQRCVHQKSCNPTSGLFGDACCSVSCFNEYACMQAFSSACPPQPVKCASGDLYLFSLEPKFDNIEQRFMCHLHYKKPKKLYQVEYFVTIPQMNFSTSVRKKIVKAENKTYHKFGRSSADFLSFFHDAVSEIDDEVIVIGNRFQKSRATKFRFHELKKPSEFNRKKRFKVRNHRADFIPHNIYSTHVQLERPFLYSSSGWSQGGCLGKNFSKIYAPQTMYKTRGIDVDPTIIKVKGKFEYQITPTSRAPYIRFLLRGNESVLNYYENLTATVMKGSLRGTVSWDQWGQKWNITITGTMNKSPAHLTMDVFDKFMTSYLGLYDILVMPPNNFSITIQLPVTPTVVPDIFIVNINDSVTCHRLSISVIDSPVTLPVDQDISNITLKHVTQFPWTPIIVTLLMTVAVLSGFVVVAVVISNQRDENESFMSKYTFLIVPREEDRINPDSNPIVQGRPISKIVMLVLVVLYALYAMMFTFSMLLGMFYMVQGPLVSNLTIVSNTSAKIHEAVGKHFREMEEFETQQVARMFNQTHERLQACSHHLKANAEKIFHDVYKGIEKDITELYSQNGTLHKLLVAILKERSKTVRDKIFVYFDNYNKAIQNYFESYLAKYTEFLRDVTNVAWLNYPRMLFMDQEGIFDSRLTLTADVTEFLDWLEVEKVSSVLEVKDRLITRLQRSLPDVKVDIPLDKDIGVIVSSTSDWTTIKSQVYQKHFVLRQENLYTGRRTLSSNGTENTQRIMEEQMASKALLMSSMKDVLFPVFICVFIVMDIFLFLYRFTWLHQMFQKAKLGAEEKIPTDSVAKKIHFTLTGHESSHPYDPLDNPYHYYIENKEDIWNGKNDLYLKFCGASPKSKEDILLEIWNHKKRQKQTGTGNSDEDCFCVYSVVRLIKLMYKHLISPILWRFVLVGAFVLIICIVIKASNDLITLDTATFLMDTRSTMPQFHRQIEVTNTMLSNLHQYTNDFLVDFQSMVDTEIKFGNNLLKDIASQQKTALQSVLSHLCTTNYTLCAKPPPDIHLADTLLSCNFLPVNVQYVKDFNDQKFMEYLHAELFPLVSTLRQLLFNTCYILFAYACLMLICHIFIRVVLLYLKKTSRLPRVFMFLVSNANDCWKEHHVNNPNKDIYRSNSWIESCESGVVGDMDDHLREPNI